MMGEATLPGESFRLSIFKISQNYENDSSFTQDLTRVVDRRFLFAWHYTKSSGVLSPVSSPDPFFRIVYMVAES